MKFKAQKTVRWDQEMAEYYSQEILARLLVGHAYIAPEAEFFRLGGGWSRVEELPASFAVDSDNTFTLPAAVISEDTVFFVDHSRDLQEAQTARETMQAFADYKKTRQDPLFARENVVACVFGRPGNVPEWTSNLPEGIVYISVSRAGDKYVYRIGSPD